MNNMYFWLGDDGEADLVGFETFEALQNSNRVQKQRWKDVRVEPAKTFFFYGIIEPIEDEDNYEANNDWDDLLNYDGKDEYEPA